MTIILKGVYFSHAFFKACQYAIANETINFGLQLVIIKTTQYAIQVCTIWPKKCGKGRVEWAKAY